MTSFKIILSLIFLINILTTQSTPRQLINVVSLEYNLNISSYLSKFIETSEHFDNRRIEDSRLSEFDYHQDFTLNEVNSIEFPKVLGSYLESLEFYLGKVKVNNDSLLIKHNFGYNLTYPEDLLTSYPKPIIYYQEDKKKEYNFEINLKQPDLTTKFDSQLIEDMKDIVAVHNIIIGISKLNNKLTAYMLIQETLYKMDLSELFDQAGKDLNLQDKEFERVLIDSNTFERKNHIMMIDSTGIVYITKVNKVEKSSENSLPKMFLSVNTHFEDSRRNLTRIVDFVKKNGIYYIAYEKMIVIRDELKELNELSLIFSAEAQRDVEFKLIDIHEVNNAIYVLVQNYGIKILDVSNPNSIRWTDFDFSHPYAQKIDSYYNPYFDYPFLAVLVDNTYNKQGTEFYIELSLKDEFKPLVYRYYQSHKHLDIRHILNEDEFTYLFEHNSNSIYVFSRTITATGKNSIYKIQPKEIHTREVTSAPFIIYDDKYVHTHLGVIAQNKFVITEKVEIKNAKMEIKFNKEGVYELEFYTFSDFCNLPREEVKMCKVFLNFTFKVTNGLSINSGLFVKGAIVCVIVLLIVLIGLLLFRLDKIKSWIRGKGYIEYNVNGDIDNQYDKASTHRSTTRSNSKDSRESNSNINLTNMPKV